MDDQRAVRLRQIAHALGLTVDDFAHPLDRHNSVQQCLELIDCYRKITDADRRERLLSYARSLAASENAATRPPL